MEDSTPRSPAGLGEHRLGGEGAGRGGECYASLPPWRDRRSWPSPASPTRQQADLSASSPAQEGSSAALSVQGSLWRGSRSRSAEDPRHQPPRTPTSMTLKSGRSDSVGSMRTALSDLYLEHLLQNKPKAEVRGVLGSTQSPASPSPQSQAEGGPPLLEIHGFTMAAAPCPKQGGRGRGPLSHTPGVPSTWIPNKWERGGGPLYFAILDSGVLQAQL